MVSSNTAENNNNKHNKVMTQRMHSSRMRTARMLPYGEGGLSDRDPPGQKLLDKDPQTETPWTENPLDKDHPGQGPPRTKAPSGQRPLLDRDRPGQRHPPVNRIPNRDPPDRDTPL